ncbi:hypothetical protein CKA32_001916 [Geitlerinema sp. FC II]|nr:hypothetical protein CKA32_001916 [Geitlerinema sp. FC II]
MPFLSQNKCSNFLNEIRFILKCFILSRFLKCVYMTIVISVLFLLV